MDEKTKKTIDAWAMWFMIIGAINWGLAIWNINLVTLILGSLGKMVTTIVYAVVGLSGVWKLMREFKLQ